MHRETWGSPRVVFPNSRVTQEPPWWLGWAPRGCLVGIPFPALCALLPYCVLLPSQVHSSHFWKQNVNCPTENPCSTGSSSGLRGADRIPPPVRDGFRALGSQSWRYTPRSVWLVTVGMGTLSNIVSVQVDRRMSARIHEKGVCFLSPDTSRM